MMKSWGLVVDIELENKREIRWLLMRPKVFIYIDIYISIYIYVCVYATIYICFMFETLCLFIWSSSWGSYWDFFHFKHWCIFVKNPNNPFPVNSWRRWWFHTLRRSKACFFCKSGISKLKKPWFDNITRNMCFLCFIVLYDFSGLFLYGRK